MSLLATRLQEFRASAPADKWEERARQYGAYDLFAAQTASPTGIITEDLRMKALASRGSALAIPVLNADTGVTVTNTVIPLTIVDSPNTSAKYVVNFVQFYFGFIMYPALYFNNEIDMQRDFNRKLQKYINATLGALNTQSQAALEAAKSQVLRDGLGGIYTLTGNTVIAPNAQAPYFIGDMDVMMRANDFAESAHVVANNSFEAQLRRIQEKQTYNTDNKSYQWDNKTFHYSGTLANPSGSIATAFWVAPDSVGLLEQYDVNCLNGYQNATDSFGIEFIPGLGQNWGVRLQRSTVTGTALDGAATAHLGATVAEGYAFHKAFAFITPYQSAPATIPSSILKVALQEPA